MSLRSIWLGKGRPAGLPSCTASGLLRYGRMVDRRRSPRLAFSQRQHARIRTVHEAVIERFDGDSAEVTTTQPAARGERLVLQFTTCTGEVTSNVAHVRVVHADRRAMTACSGG